MIKVHIGRYYYGDSSIHHLDPKTKIISFICLIIAIFITKSSKGLIIISLFLLFTIILARIHLRSILNYIRPMSWLFLTILIVNIFFSDNNSKGLFSITTSQEVIFHGLKLAYKFLLIIIASAVVSMTTMPLQIANAISQIWHLHQLSIMLGITLNFIPRLLLESERSLSIQKARGIRRIKLLENGKWLLTMIFSLLRTAFRLADDMAISMESRCYSGGSRTHLYDFHFNYTDILALALSFSMIPLIFITDFQR